MKKVGIALGGGGAKGFAHIAYLQALDEMGVTPSVISGTSMGSIIGAFYVSGYKPGDILDVLNSLTSSRISSVGILSKLQLLPPPFAAAWVKKLIKNYLSEKTFEETRIPFKTVAVDFHTLEEKIFTEGLLIDGVMASIALPGFFPPYAHDGKFYIDGGAVNIVPFSTIREQCDILIAVDVSMQRNNFNLTPTAQNALIATWNAASAMLLQYQFGNASIDLLERPEYPDIGITEFHKYQKVYEQTLEHMPEFKKNLSLLL
jgi:NTE family protein